MADFSMIAFTSAIELHCACGPIARSRDLAWRLFRRRRPAGHRVQRHRAAGTWAAAWAPHPDPLQRGRGDPLRRQAPRALAAPQDRKGGLSARLHRQGAWPV